MVVAKTAYFGFEEYTPHEFCIKANKDGLKTFAAKNRKNFQNFYLKILEEISEYHYLNKKKL